MTAKDELLKERFLLNMGRIDGLTHLLTSNEALKPTGLFRSEGVRGDILRSIVVFLHATFEVVLTSHIPKPNKKLSFYSRPDLDKALKLSGIDSKPFKYLYPPLTQMAKRRKRIVHEADISKRPDALLEEWGFIDDWQLIMWLMAVRAFYYQMRLSVNVASEEERTSYQTLRKAMGDHVDFGKQYSAFPEVPPELRREALQKWADTLESIITMLKLDPLLGGGQKAK